MKHTFLLLALTGIACTTSAQVKIGHNASTPPNPAAVLELSNDLTAAPNQWKAVLLPRVDFTNAAFTNNTTWGIAGMPTDGLMVYNTGNRTTGDFEGAGVYVWTNGAWVPLNKY